MRRKIAIHRLYFQGEGRVRFFAAKLRMLSTSQSSPLCTGKEADRIAAVLPFGGIERLIVLSIVKAFGLKDE